MFEKTIEEKIKKDVRKEMKRRMTLFQIPLDSAFINELLEVTIEVCRKDFKVRK
jgi:hypothetical protein